MTRSRRISFLGMAAGILSILVSSGCGNSLSLDASVLPTTNPLVAKYTVMVPPSGGVAWVEFGPDTNYGRQTSPSAATTGDRQLASVLVAGMKANTTYHLLGHVTWPDGQTWSDQDRTFTTGQIPAPPAGLTLPGIAVHDPTAGLKPADGVELFNVFGPGTMLRAFVTDLLGNVIWYYDLGPNEASPDPMRLMPNGHFLLGIGELLEVDLAGNTIRDITLDQLNRSLKAKGYDFQIQNFHHDVIVLPNGHWIALTRYFKNYTNLIGFPGVTPVLGDALVDIDLNGNVAWAWSSFDHLDVNRHLQAFPSEGIYDWTHSNAIIYTEDGNLLLSMRHQSWIIKIDYENGSGSGDILWRLGWEGDFAIAGGDVSDWFYAQHYPNLETSDGGHLTLDVFDNGDLRVAPDGDMCSATCYSRATVFDVDENARVATLTWQFLPGFYSYWGGSIATLSNRDIEFDMSTVSITPPTSQIMEVTQDEPAKTVWQLNLTGEYAYRGYRIPSLYPGVSWKN